MVPLWFESGSTNVQFCAGFQGERRQTLDSVSGLGINPFWFSFASFCDLQEKLRIRNSHDSSLAPRKKPENYRGKRTRNTRSVTWRWIKDKGCIKHGPLWFCSFPVFHLWQNTGQTHKEVCSDHTEPQDEATIMRLESQRCTPR